MTRSLRLLAAVLVVVTALTGCGSSANRGAIPDRGYPPAQAALAAMKGKVLATGPNGEQPASAASITLTPGEIEQVKDKKATAAIVMHYTGDGWTDAQVAGLRQQFGELGIEVIAVTDAGFLPDRQVSNIETVLARNPNIIVSIPADPVATAGAYKQAAAAGVKLVFMDNVPLGMQAGRDYVSVVSADNVGTGVVAAHLMAVETALARLAHPEGAARPHVAAVDLVARLQHGHAPAIGLELDRPVERRRAAVAHGAGVHDQAAVPGGDRGRDDRLQHRADDQLGVPAGDGGLHLEGGGDDGDGDLMTQLGEGDLGSLAEAVVGGDEEEDAHAGVTRSGGSVFPGAARPPA